MRVWPGQICPKGRFGNESTLRIEKKTMIISGMRIYVQAICISDPFSSKKTDFLLTAERLIAAMCETDTLYKDVKSCSLFAGLDDEQCLFLLEYLKAHHTRYEKGGIIYSQENETDTFAVIMQGTVEMVRYDCWGNRFLILTQGSGTCLGLAGTLFERWIPDTHVIARSECDLLFLDAKKLRTSECLSIPACAMLKNNISKQLARKETELLGKLSLIHCRSTREKVSFFLSQEAALHRSKSFDIELSRQDMADFLSVDRSALSKELSRMKQEGLIDYHLNHFEIKEAAQA